MTATLRTARAALPFATLALALAAGCGRAAPAPPAEPAADAEYTVRAEIARLPAAADGDLHLRHEEIPSFRDRQGETVGMMSMTMPFDVPDGLDLAGLAAGDRVEVAFEVRWAQRNPLRLKRLTRLPPDTRLSFDPPAEETAEPAAQPGETPR